MKQTKTIELPLATTTHAGLMSKENVSDLSMVKSDVARLNTTAGSLRTSINNLDSSVNGLRSTKADVSQLNTLKADVSQLNTLVGNHKEIIVAMHAREMDNYKYGVEWDVNVADPDVKRIGNMDLHRSLPVQSAMRGCLLDDDGNVVEYLPENDWTTAVRDGSRGQVMVRIPRHYRRFVKDGNKRQVWFSEKPLPGYHESPEFFVSAYEATIQRSTGKLCSVMNADPDYRGGVNDASVDADPVKTKLGKCADDLTLLQYREAATLRNPTSKRWCQYIYEAHKTLVWMFVVEYATINARKDFVAELTADGYRQGGITKTNSNLTSALLKENFNGGAVSTIGWTDEFGNGSGAKRFDAGTFYTTTLRYRGIENFTSHMHKWLDGLNTSHNEWVCVSNNPAIFSSENSDGYRKAWALPPSEKEGYPKDVMMGEFGDIFPVDVTGTLTTHWACYTSSYGPGWSTIKPVGSCYVAGAPYVNNYYNLLTIDYGAYFPNSTKYAAHNGARLCYIPESAN